MLFSVVIPTYNRAALLKRALESVFTQTFTDYEVIVVDDGSTDNTLALVRAYHQVRVFKQQNQGPGAARNLGVGLSSGQYIAFLDSDDIWLPWTLATFAQLIREHRRPAILTASVSEFLDESELVAITNVPIQAAAFPEYLAASRLGYYVGSGMAVLRRNIFLESGGFMTGRFNAEDHDLALRLGLASGFVQVLTPVTLGWRRHMGGATKNLQHSVEGTLYLVEQERRGVYPGLGGRSRERREIISRHVRPVALECLKQGLRHEAWQLYRRTFWWNVVLGRWKFLGGFPLNALLS